MKNKARYIRVTETVFAKATKKRKAFHKPLIPIVLGKLKNIRFRKHKLHKTQIIGLCIAITLLCLIWVFSFSPLFVIKQITCTLDDQPCPEVLNAEIHKLNNKHIRLLDTDAFTRQILFTFPTIQSVSITTQLPETLHISMISRKPVAAIEDPNGSYYLIDGENKVFAEGYQDGLVKIQSTDTVTIGETALSPMITAATNLRSIFAQSYIPVVSIRIDQIGFLDAQLGSGIHVFFNPNRDITKQVDALQFILNNSKIDTDEPITTVDLRFDNPVIK